MDSPESVTIYTNVHALTHCNLISLNLYIKVVLVNNLISAFRVTLMNVLGEISKHISRTIE